MNKPSNEPTYYEIHFCFNSCLRYDSTGLAFQKELSESYGFYSFRCQLLDPIVHANLGIEIRGFYGQADPYFGIYLSKSFTLKKLTEY